MIASTIWKPLDPIVFIFSRGKINLWHRQLGHVSIDTLRKFDDCYICPPRKIQTLKALKKYILHSTSSKEVQSDVMGLLGRGYYAVTQVNLVTSARVPGRVPGKEAL